MNSVPAVYTTKDQEKYFIVSTSLGKEVSKSDLTVELTETSVKVSDQKENLIFVGNFFSRINPTKSSWDLNNKGQFSMILEKKEHISWDIGILHDFNGKIDAHSAFLLSLYNERKGDFRQAFKFLRTSAQKNHLTSLFKLGALYQSGNKNYKIEQDLEQTIEFYKRGAHLGDGFAAYCLGCIYHIENDIEVNNKKAITYFEMASEKKFSKANIYLGRIYLTGAGDVKKNVKKAYNYFKLAAEQEEISAMIQIGIMLIEGEGIKRDFELANQYFQKVQKKDSSVTIPIEYLQILHKGQKEYESELTSNKPDNGKLRNGLIFGSIILVAVGIGTYLWKRKEKKNDQKN
ncbi:sel1-repeat-containing protein ybeq [Anaeramoeba flamelloides]|uniref:Sel1-repeat-containing protein ybeq n=1 Tax=Anaeramoeba flamelloides TaxID=1746091 RepID=A0AAV7ZFE9_9EUKA|nr:sel1-repeat-containing protein ybeq [Anaeramoeba flamelloides]